MPLGGQQELCVYCVEKELPKGAKRTSHKKWWPGYERSLVEEGSPLMGMVLGSIPGSQQKAAEEEGEKTLLALWQAQSSTALEAISLERENSEE